jgi:hypothetical protein
VYRTCVIIAKVVYLDQQLTFINYWILYVCHHPLFILVFYLRGFISGVILLHLIVWILNLLIPINSRSTIISLSHTHSIIYLTSLNIPNFNASFPFLMKLILIPIHHVYQWTPYLLWRLLIIIPTLILNP